MIGTTVTLPTGGQLPHLGLGVFQAKSGGPARRAVAAALEMGYRHVDTAAAYKNERDVGEGIRDSGIPRSEIFVTTKLWNTDHGFDAARRAFDASLKRLGLDYIDLYLVHWPVPKLRRDSWRALEQLFDERRARAIGVSNYMVNHLEELLGEARVPPAVNQIEVSPFLQMREVRAVCRAHGIVVEAYSPLTKGVRLDHAVVGDVARRIGKTPAQVLLRWGLQHDMVVLPKSVRPERIRENAAIFDFVLDEESMAQLDGLEEGLVTGWDPRGQP